MRSALTRPASTSLHRRQQDKPLAGGGLPAVHFKLLLQHRDNRIVPREVEILSAGATLTCWHVPPRSALLVVCRG
jgi:hypothetical protein